MEQAPSKLSWAVGKKTVLCVGSTNIDCISIVKRFPKPNIPEHTTKAYWQRGGNAANNCTVLKNLGVNVEFLGMLSSLPMFSILWRDMRSRGIQIDNCPRCLDEPPFSSVIMNRRTRSCTLVNCNKSFPYVSFEDFQKLDLSKYGWIHFRCRMPEETLKMMKMVEDFNAQAEQDEKIVISMDFDSSLKENWPMVNYCDFIFFERELAKEEGWKNMKEASLNIDELLRMRFGINLKRPYFVFMWDLQHWGLMDRDSNYSEAPTYNIEKFVESLGFYEVFVACFIYAVYVRERSEDVAADFASRMANFKCTKCGFDHLADILVAPKL